MGDAGAPEGLRPPWEDAAGLEAGVDGAELIFFHAAL